MTNRQKLTIVFFGILGLGMFFALSSVLLDQTKILENSISGVIEVADDIAVELGLRKTDIAYVIMFDSQQKIVGRTQISPLVPPQTFQVELEQREHTPPLGLLIVTYGVAQTSGASNDAMGSIQLKSCGIKTNLELKTTEVRLVINQLLFGQSASSMGNNLLCQGVFPLNNIN